MYMSTTWYIHACTSYIHVYTMYMHVHCMYMYSLYTYMYILTWTDIWYDCLLSIMLTSKTSKPWPTWRILRMYSCVSCVHAHCGWLPAALRGLAHGIELAPCIWPVPPDQYEIESASLADHNLDVPCDSGICFPSYMVMLLRKQTQSKCFVILCLVLVHTALYRVCNIYIHDIYMFVLVHYSHMVFYASQL